MSVLAAPDGADVVSLEWCTDFVNVLCDEASQRDRQIESQGDVAAAVVEETKQLLVGFVAALAEQNLRVLE